MKVINTKKEIFEKEVSLFFRNYSLSDQEKIKEAYIFSKKAHKGQKRKSGEDYFIHPLEVAKILANLKLGYKNVIAGLLHDVIEDTKVTKKEIEQQFGSEVAEFVDAVSALTKVDFGKFADSSDAEIYRKKIKIEALRKLFLTMAGDIRVVLIKLADRLHNMRTLEYLPEKKRKRIALETLEIFAPLANRLGMGSLKSELEDLSFKHLYSAEYENIKTNVKPIFQSKEADLKGMESDLKNKLSKAYISAKVDSRAKHYFSIYKKLKKTEGDFTRIYDLMALRIVVDDVEDCYKVLGLIHASFKPLIYRIKDYIAVPKPNGYRSLHTTVFGTGGKIFEIQIRTKKMHEESERGVAAHWNYDEKKKDGYGVSVVSKKEGWVEELLNLDKESLEDDEFFEGLKIDIFKDRIFVFSPKGEVYDLPEGSTPVDFAYAVHSNIGEKLTGSKINGKITPIDSKLENRDIVEIITSKNAKGPKKDWLSFVITSKAKQNIRSFFRKLNREENILIGKKEIEEELSQMKLSLKSIKKVAISDAISNMPYKTLDDIFAALGEGSLSLKKFVSKILPEEAKEKKFSFKENPMEVIEKNYLKILKNNDILFKISSCCNPKENDFVLGYITKGKGISIHKSTCKNVLNGPKERIVAINWKHQKDEKIIKNYEINTKDRIGMLSDICKCISEVYLNILNINITQEEKLKKARVILKLNGRSTDQFLSFERRLELLTDIFEYKILK